MQILINTLNGKTFSIDTNESDTIHELKVKIHEQINIPPDQQRLNFLGKTLYANERCTLSDNQISDGDTINLTSRLTSGPQIFVKTLTDRTLSFEVDLNDSIKSLKNKIEAKEGIPRDQQCLIFAEKLLNDESKLSEYDIWKESSIQLVLHGGPIIFIKAHTNKIFTLEVEASNTIEEIKNKIQDKEGMPKEKQCLIYSGIILKNCHSLSDYNITMESTLDLKLHDWDEVKIFVHMLTKSDQPICFKVNIESKLEDVKDLIETKTSIPPDRQRLLYNNKEMKDYQSLATYNVENEAIFWLIPLVKVIIKTSNNKTFTVKVGESDTIERLKEIIETKKSIPLCLQCLYLDSQLLENEYTLAEYTIKENSTLYLSIQICEDVKIFIATLNGENFSIRVKLLDTVKLIKIKIQEKEGIPINNQYIWFNGKFLENNAILAEHKISKNSTLQLLLQSDNVFLIMPKTDIGEPINETALINQDISIKSTEDGECFDDKALKVVFENIACSKLNVLFVNSNILRAFLQDETSIVPSISNSLNQKTDILVPLHINNNHWICLYVNIPNQTITSIDPSSINMSVELQKTTTKLMNFFETCFHQLLNHTTFKLRLVKSPKHTLQNKSFDCGVLSAIYAERITSKQELTDITLYDILKMRQKARYLLQVDGQAIIWSL